MLVLSFDPGTTSTGWSFVEVPLSPREPATVLEVGNVGSTFELVSSRILQGTRPDVVAIEWLQGFAFPSKGEGVVDGLVASAAVAGLIEGIARMSGLRVEKLTAREWRHQVVGRPNASDREIKTALELLVKGLPKRSNSHERDAVGVALAVGRRRIQHSAFCIQPSDERPRVTSARA